MHYPLRPNFRAREFLIPLLATIYAPPPGNEDFSVLSRKFHLALSILTELMKKKSELRESSKILREKLEKVRASFSMVKADRKIFEEHNPRPKPRRVFFLTLKTKKEKEYEEKIRALDEMVASAQLKVTEVEQERNKIVKSLDEANASYEKQQREVDEIRNNLVKAGIFNMCSFVLEGEMEEYTRTYLDVRAISRGDKRLHIVRCILEALVENPHHGFGIFGDIKDLFLPETSAEFRLVENFLNFLNGSEINQKALGIFLPSHFSFEENYSLYLFLEASNLASREEILLAKEGFSLLVRLIYKWSTDEPLNEVEIEKVDPTAEPLLAELLSFSLISQGREMEALKKVGFNLSEEEFKNEDLKFREKARLSFIKFSEIRQRVNRVFLPSVERLFAHILIGVKRVASNAIFSDAKEILNPKISGVLDMHYAKECFTGKPPIVNRKNPAELYWAI